MEEKNYTVKMTVKTTIRAEDAEQAKELFWHYYHHDKDEIESWNLIIEEQGQ